MPQPIQAPESFQDVIFPARGLDVSVEREEQPYLTSVLGLNVRNFEPITFRGRGGIRSGLSKYINAKVNGTALIQHIQIIVDPQAAALGDSFVDGAAGYDLIIPNEITPYILADGSYDTTGPNGSGYHTSKTKKRKYPQLIIKAKDQTKAQGTTFTWSGNEYTITHGALLSGDTIFSVTFRSDGADASAANGTYPITPSNTVFRLSNAPGYEVIYKKGTMTVGGIEFIQAITSSAPTGGILLPDNVTAGNLVIVVIANNFGQVSTVTDSLGNTYSSAGARAHNSVSNMEVWYTVTSSSGPNTVNITFTTGPAAAAVIMEYSGLNATPLDSYVPQNTSSGFNNLTTGSVSVSGANNLVLGCFMQTSDNEVFTPGNAAIVRGAYDRGDLLVALYVEELINTTTGPMTGTLDGVGNLNGCVCIGISFKP